MSIRAWVAATAIIIACVIVLAQISNPEPALPNCPRGRAAHETCAP